MKKLCVFLFGCVTFSAHLQAAQSPVYLYAASSFTVLAGSTVTNTGFTAVVGDVGLSPGSSVTGFPPGTITGGALHVNDSAATSAQAALSAAYLDAAGRSVAPVTLTGDLGGLTLAPGLYKAPSTSMAVGAGETLTLDGQGNANAVWIFQVGSTLTTVTGSNMVLIGNANPANIFLAGRSISNSRNVYHLLRNHHGLPVHYACDRRKAVWQGFGRECGGHNGFQSDGEPRTADHEPNASAGGRHLSTGHCPSRCRVQLLTSGHGRHAVLHVFNYGIAAAGFEPGRCHRTSHWDPDYSEHLPL